MATLIIVRATRAQARGRQVISLESPMPTEPRWIVSLHASSLHAAAAVLSEAPLADRKLAEALADEIAQLGSELDALGMPAGRFFS